MTEILIKTEELAIGYGGQPVLSGISLSVTPDSFVAILGANGSGKSTLFKTLLRLIPPVGGRLHIAERQGRPLVFGYVPQSSELDSLYLLTGLDVALMGCYGRVGAGRRPSGHERDFTRECLAAAGAEQFAKRRFSELSGGQKQRILIARALATRPDVLMLDEPTSGVDHAATHEIMGFLSKICSERKIAVLLITHDFGVVRRHAQHVVWLHQGKVLQGTAQELLTSERLAEMLEMEGE